VAAKRRSVIYVYLGLLRRYSSVCLRISGVADLIYSDFLLPSLVLEVGIIESTKMMAAGGTTEVVDSTI